MTPQSDDIIKWYDSLDEAKKESYTPIKVVDLVQFFTLAGRKSVLLKEILIPIPDLQYLVLGTDGKYYFRSYRGYGVDDMVFYYSDKISLENEEIEALLRYFTDGRIWLLFTPQMIEDMKAMLQRVYKGKVAGEGTLEYKDFVTILSESIRYEEYRRIGASLTGYKTVCKGFDERLNDMWRRVYEKNQK